MPCKTNQGCCNHDCNQGRECPNRHSENAPLFTQIMWFVIIALLLITAAKILFK